MISLSVINQEIEKLKQKETTYDTCERLACLIIVRDHLRGYPASVQKPLSISESNSEFLKVVNGKNPDAAWMIMNEHMEAIRVLYPKEYAAIIKRLESI